MKIACIISYTYLPAFSGGQKLIAGFYENLAEVTDLHAFGTPENDISLVKNYQLMDILRSSRLRYADLSAFFKIRNYLKKQQIKTLIIEHPFLGWLGWMLRKSCGLKLIIHTHNVEYQRFRSLGKNWWWLLKQYEKWVLQKADLVFCITEEDRNTMITELHVSPGKCVIVPYGIHHEKVPSGKQETKKSVCEEFNIPQQDFLLFFNGLLNYKPNIDALDVILNKINPLLLQKNFTYKILIAGKHLPPEYNSLTRWNRQNIMYLGFVDDIDRYTFAADILLNPVLSGGGVKTKMVEAIALGTTVVANETGASGMDSAICGDKLIICKDNDWTSFADAVMNCKSQTSPTPELFYKKHYWGNIISNLLGWLS